jgi:hypothetical protein
MAVPRSPSPSAPRSPSTCRCRCPGSAKRQAAALRGEIRPDADNYIKAALDAVNAIVVVDDALIVELMALKCYAPVAKLTIRITELPGATAQPKKKTPVGGGDSAALDLLERARR